MSARANLTPRAMSGPYQGVGDRVRDDRAAAFALAAGVRLGPGNLMLTDPRPTPSGRGWWDKRLLLQDLEWVDVTGRTHLLESMGVLYRENVAAFVELHAASMVRDAAHSLCLEAVEGHLDRTEAVRQLRLLSRLTGPWIRETPLVDRLLCLNARAHAATPHRDLP